MLRALIEYRIEGPRTNIPVLRWILSEPDYIAGEVDTGWLEKNLNRFQPPRRGHGNPDDIAIIAAAIHSYRSATAASRGVSPSEDGCGGGLSPWVRIGRARRLRRDR